MSTEKQGYALQGVKWGPDFRGVRDASDQVGTRFQGVRGTRCRVGTRFRGQYAAQGVRLGPDFGETLVMQIICVKGLFFAY